MVDVVLLRVKITPGWPQRFAEVLARLLLVEQFLMDRGGPFGNALRRRLNDELEPILEAEGMHTESIFLDRNDGDLSLLWYMEAESMAGVYEGFLESEDRLTEVAGPIAGWLFEDAERILTPDVESDYPLLAHAWHPDRP